MSLVDELDKCLDFYTLKGNVIEYFNEKEIEKKLLILKVKNYFKVHAAETVDFTNDTVPGFLQDLFYNVTTCSPANITDELIEYIDQFDPWIGYKDNDHFQNQQIEKVLSTYTGNMANLYMAAFHSMQRPEVLLDIEQTFTEMTNDIQGRSVDLDNGITDETNRLQSLIQNTTSLQTKNNNFNITPLSNTLIQTDNCVTEASDYNNSVTGLLDIVSSDMADAAYTTQYIQDYVDMSMVVTPYKFPHVHVFNINDMKIIPGTMSLTYKTIPFSIPNNVYKVQLYYALTRDDNINIGNEYNVQVFRSTNNSAEKILMNNIHFPSNDRKRRFYSTELLNPESPGTHITVEFVMSVDMTLFDINVNYILYYANF
ncbi:hypothetical protein ECIV_ORF67 [European chub iridovirus]|nr:hypothetical protein ECIV_ORF67 [European chub iridovirus]